MKKIILIMMVALITAFCFTPAAFAQVSDPFAQAEALFANESPLTQADIDAFVKIGPSMVQASIDNDTAAAQQLMQEAGFTEIRGSYVTAKISNAYAIIFQPEYAQSMLKSAQMPNALLPSQAEIDLVQKNLPALEKVFAQMF